MEDTIAYAGTAPVGPDEARVGVTYNGQFSELPQTVRIAATDAEIRTWVTEAVRSGSIPGLGTHPNASFVDFVVERFPSNEARPYASVMLRPKTPFGV